MSLAPISHVRETGASGLSPVPHPAQNGIVQNNNPARGRLKIFIKHLC